MDELLVQKKKRVQAKVLRSAFENLFIFAVPAFLALGVIKYIQIESEVSTSLMAIIFGATFIFSWSVVIVRMKRLHTEVREMEDEFNKASHEDGGDKN